MTVESLAKKIRIHSLNMANSGGGSHIASALSIADILAVLYGKVLSINPSLPSDKNRDRFILSKGHAGAAVYAVLAELGYFSQEKLKTHYKNGSELSGHVSHKGIPGVELSTGSLGHGLGVGVGMAAAIKRKGGAQRVFVLLSDGECDEGSNWEAILFAQHHKLDNLVAIIDYNKIQSLAPVEETIALEPFADKWRAFNWSVKEVDGHNLGSLEDSFSQIPLCPDRPTVIIAHTTKGKGVSFMEDTVLWHYRCPRGEEYRKALEELQL